MPKTNIMGIRKYNTEEERKEAKRERNRRYRAEHKEELAAKRAAHKDEKAAYDAVYYSAHKEEKAAYYATPFGRATNLVSTYRKEDKKHNRGECTVTPQWMVGNVFSGQCCVYCGESDWHKLGCDRLDNSKPHTQDNVVPCCCDCNKKKNITPYDDFMRRIGKIA